MIESDDFDAYVEAECFPEASGALRSLFLKDHKAAKTLYEQQAK